MSKQLRNAFEKGMPFGGIGVHPDLDKSGRGAAAMAASAAPAGPTRASGVKEHDLVNTANVAQVLQAGEFRLRPGVDFVGYDELKELRLEDGLDVSRKVRRHFLGRGLDGGARWGSATRRARSGC
jgi:hypothetical protein